MSYKHLEHYLSRGKKGTIGQIIRRLECVGANSFSHDSYSHKAAVLMQKTEFTKKMRQDMSLLYFTADLEDFMHCMERKKGLNDYFEALSTSRYTYKKNIFEYHQEMMIENILYMMNERKIIFFQMGVPDYITFETPQRHAYNAHALCIIMIPRKDNYDCYYINSHGHTIDTQHYYEFIMSRKRKRKMKLSESADVVFMKALVSHINKKSDIKVNYDGTSKYTYRGTNLQAGDSHGVCFIYPLIIWYSIGKYYTRKQVLDTDFGKISVATGKSLMKSGRFNHFIESMFWKFCPKYSKLLCRQCKMKAFQQEFSESMETQLEKDNYRFIKMLIGPYISYIQQSMFMRKIKYRGVV
uniref:Uncharacterized protein n=1 Tax=viral metagenome TaxID=1070528 RepID=A0A6C0C6F4_9ZZZZ